MTQVAYMTPDEMELYDNAGIAIADARGAVELAMAEGEARGEARGRDLGLREGARRILLSLLQQRFGPTPEWVSAQISAADSETLEEWTGKILVAESLTSLFSPLPADAHPPTE
ncbi:MAG: hypothetical protein HQL57_05350 [Magnetococcales bacterium]|nr:hypothetical protein [Magnetococcales bacterium]MBF0156591.1 hypothetical protein [Magnetococcales bacterium]